jgi:hypothetical protein
MENSIKNRVRRATLIGDIVGSRKVEDRDVLQNALEAALSLVNRTLEPAQVLQVTLGDEFQGGFDDVATAVDASLLLRLQLLKDAGVESRYGLGFGLVTAYEQERAPFSQDGPGWWAARDAIGLAAHLERRAHTAYARTQFKNSEQVAEEQASEGKAVNGFLLCRDAMVSAMSPRSQRLLLGYLLRRQQVDLAAEEGISQSAVSQNLATSGAYAIEAAFFYPELLEKL